MAARDLATRKWWRAVGREVDLRGPGECARRLSAGVRHVQVFLRPSIDADGSLRLCSAGNGFGDNGAYVVVGDRGRTFAACVPLRERFHVWVDEEDVLRTDHEMSLWSMPVVGLHYRIDKVAS